MWNKLQTASKMVLILRSLSVTESRDGEHEDNFASGNGEEVGTSFVSAAAQGLAR